MTTSFNATKDSALGQSLLTKAYFKLAETTKESYQGKTFRDFSLSPSELPPQSIQRLSPLVFSLLNRPHETLYLEPHKGLSEKGHLLAWIKKEEEPKHEAVTVKGFRGVEGQELLEKILFIGAKNLVAIRTSQEVVLLPRLDGAALDDDDVTLDFISRFNENTLNHAEYKAKALEFVSKLREMGGLEDVPATALNKVRAGFVRLAKCKDERVIEAAMLSLYEFEEKSRAGLLKQDLTAPSSTSSLGSLSGSVRASSSQPASRLSGSATGEGLIQAFLELLEVLDSEYFITITPDTQCIVLKAYNCLLESIISYSGQEGQVPLVSRMEESRRRAIISQLQKVKGLTWTESQPEATYLVRLALEGSKRLADDTRAWEKGARRMVKFCVALKAAWDQDIANVLDNLVQIYKDVEILKDWYELVYVIREMGKSVAQDKRYFTKFMQLINDKKVKKGAWELPYTAASSLGDVIRNSQEPYIRLCALEGYDPEGRGKLLKGLWAHACFKGYSTFMSKPDEGEVSRVRYKAAEALKSLENHQDTNIVTKVQFYLNERETRESTPCIKNLLAMPFILPEQRVQEILGPKTPLKSPQDSFQDKSPKSSFSESATQGKSIATGSSSISSPADKKEQGKPSFLTPSSQKTTIPQEDGWASFAKPFNFSSTESPKESKSQLESSVNSKRASPFSQSGAVAKDDWSSFAKPFDFSPGGAAVASKPQPKEKPQAKPKRKGPKKRSSVTAESTPLPPAEQNELIQKKLQNPQQDLPLEESITLLTQCIQYGKIEAQKAHEKEAVIFIGNTGAGKSTTINYLYGCTMQLKSADDLDEGLVDIIVVKPPSEGGSLAEVMPIGHTKESKTFMPQIETDTAQSITYCDCPGFLDNRGAEINIANAVNIKNAISKAKSVTVIMLINFHSLMADRARGLSEMLKISSNLFGKSDNLVRHKESVLIGVTNIPSNMKLERLKKWIVKDTTPLMETLAERIFIFDPLDHPPEGGLVREELLTRIKSLKPITNQSKIFSTVLTDEDETKLIRISEQIGQKIQSALKSKDFKQAASHYHRLQELRLIDHVTIERLLSTNRQRIERQLQDEKNAIMTHCHFERFTQAEKQLQELEEALEYFDEEIEESLTLSSLQEYYDSSKQKAEEAQRKDEEYRQQLNAAHKQIQEFIKLLDQQKRNTEEQLRQQQEAFAQAMQEMENTMKRTAEGYDQMKNEIQKEMQARLAQKEEELKTIQGQNREEIAQKLEQEKAKLNSEYAQKLQEMELERKRVAAEQQALKDKAAKDLEAEKARLQQKIQELESSKQQKRAEQEQKEKEQARLEQAKQEKARAEELARSNVQATSNPPQAFGKKDWEKYFGDVGVEPKLPSNIHQILQSDCPIWPGKKIADTHLLTLIPQSVNGEPLTLNYLEKLIQSPKGGGNATKYNYDNDVKNAIGAKSIDSSYWVLLSKDILPNTRNKSYQDQCKELERLKGQSAPFKEGGYRVPKALEAATSILMEYVRSGNRLYSNIPTDGTGKWTYTRCSETSTRGWQVLIGGFAASGLDVNAYGLVYDDDGLGAACEV